MIRAPLDNNATERGRVVGRKNHYGSRSKRGTEVDALGLLSLAQRPQ
jgi:transposase